MNNTCLEKNIERPEIVKEPPKRYIIKPNIEEVKIPIKTKVVTYIENDEDTTEYLRKDKYLSEFANEEALNRVKENLNISDSGNLIYTPSESILNGIKSQLHGGLTSTDVAEFRNNKITLSQLMDRILYPTQIPTIKDPSITYKHTLSSSIEYGSELPQISYDNINSNLTFNLGSVTLNNKTALLPDGSSLVRANSWFTSISFDKDNWGTTAINGKQTLTISREYTKGSKLYNNYGELITLNDNLDTDGYLKAGTAQCILLTTGYYRCFFNGDSLKLKKSWDALESDRYIGHGESTFDCPSDITPTFYIQGLIQGQYDLDKGGKWTATTLETVPETVIDKKLTYTRWTRLADQSNISGGVFKIIIN